MRVVLKKIAERDGASEAEVEAAAAAVVAARPRAARERADDSWGRWSTSSLRSPSATGTVECHNAKRCWTHSLEGMTRRAFHSTTTGRGQYTFLRGLTSARPRRTTM